MKSPALGTAVSYYLLVIAKTKNRQEFRTFLPAYFQATRAAFAEEISPYATSPGQEGLYAGSIRARRQS